MNRILLRERLSFDKPKTYTCLNSVHLHAPMFHSPSQDCSDSLRSPKVAEINENVVDIFTVVYSGIFEAFTVSETVTSHGPDIQHPLTGPFQRVIKIWRTSIMCGNRFDFSKTRHEDISALNLMGKTTWLMDCAKRKNTKSLDNWTFWKMIKPKGIILSLNADL